MTVAKLGLRQGAAWGVMMTSLNPNYFIHAANVLLLVAYSVRDILWLRLFAVAAALISLPYFEVSAALHFFGVATDDGLRRLA